MDYNFYHPLMENNITQADINELIEFLKTTPRLTQSKKVREFENLWSKWLGVKYSVFLNSGSSANMMTLAIIKHIYGAGEIILSPLNWVSDVVAVLKHGFTPVFIDISPKTLALDENALEKAISEKTKAVLLTHIQGFNGLTNRILKVVQENDIPLIEDVCEAHGAEFLSKKCGTFGLISNFSFYFAHHMSSIEGGMLCTDNEEIYQLARMFRSHGMVREMTNETMKQEYIARYPDLSPDFIFAVPGWNFRNTEIGAVLAISQLKKLDYNNERRKRNFEIFIQNLDPAIYRTDFNTDGSCNYAFNLILQQSDITLKDRLEHMMKKKSIEFRRGSSGGGNQLRQPYIKQFRIDVSPEKYPETEHIHFFGYYIGNYPELSKEKILDLCNIFNSIKK